MCDNLSTQFSKMPLVIWLLVAVSANIPLSVESLKCYNCSNVTNTQRCNTSVSCSSGQRCFTSTTGIGNAETYDLGCKSESECLSGLSAGLVGRSVSNSNKCFQCCKLDNCNVNLCSAGTQVINEVGPCRDDPNFDCAKVSSSFPICSDVHHAKTICRKFCGLCDLVDGSWSDWSSWSSCDVTCGSGHIKRTRTCTDPTPAHGGLDCVGDATDTSTCVLGRCPVHGGWSRWNSWGYCSVTCGMGLERRDRTCSNPYPSANGDHCFGDSRDDRPCFTRACADGVWSTWSHWGSCSASCLGGLQLRTRTCDNPLPSKFGHDCVGNSEEYQACNNKKCHEDLPIAFRATQLSSLSSSSNFRTLIYSRTELNIGGGYDNKTGIFTAPETGVYTFTAQLCFPNRNGYIVQLMKDSHVLLSSNFYNYYSAACESTTATEYVANGVKVFVRVKAGANIYQTPEYINMFQGTIIRG